MTETVKDKDAGKAKRQEAELDEGLEETFPASDPPAATQPGDGGKHGRDDRNETKRR